MQGLHELSVPVCAEERQVGRKLDPLQDNVGPRCGSVVLGFGGVGTTRVSAFCVHAIGPQPFEPLPPVTPVAAGATKALSASYDAPLVEATAVAAPLPAVVFSHGCAAQGHPLCGTPHACAHATPGLLSTMHAYKHAPAPLPLFMCQRAQDRWQSQQLLVHRDRTSLAGAAHYRYYTTGCFHACMWRGADCQTLHVGRRGCQRSAACLHAWWQGCGMWVLLGRGAPIIRSAHAALLQEPAPPTRPPPLMTKGHARAHYRQAHVYLRARAHICTQSRTH